MNREADGLETISHKAEAGSARPAGQALPTSPFNPLITLRGGSCDHPHFQEEETGAQRESEPSQVMSEQCLPNEAVQPWGLHTDTPPPCSCVQLSHFRAISGALEMLTALGKGQRNAPPAQKGWLTTGGGGYQGTCAAAFCHLIQPPGSRPGVCLGPAPSKAPSPRGSRGEAGSVNTAAKRGASADHAAALSPHFLSLARPTLEDVWMVRASLEDPRVDHPQAPARVQRENSLVTEAGTSTRGQQSKPRREALCRPPNLLRAGNPQAGPPICWLLAVYKALSHMALSSVYSRQDGG